ncbi:MAG: hypothetical protein H7338_06320 [Candidatus Sericytochromatia bacterium]|nr:hypothetical protein [Candidatus Sericytochromatia bacterium]
MIRPDLPPAQVPELPAATPPASQPLKTAVEPTAQADQLTLQPKPQKPFFDHVRAGFSHSWFVSEQTGPATKQGYVSRNGLRLEAGHTLWGKPGASLAATASLTADKGNLSYLVVPAVGLRGELGNAKKFAAVYASAAVGPNFGQLDGHNATGIQAHAAIGVAGKCLFVEYGLDKGTNVTGHNITGGVRFNF